MGQVLVAEGPVEKALLRLPIVGRDPGDAGEVVVVVNAGGQLVIDEGKPGHQLIRGDTAEVFALQGAVGVFGFEVFAFEVIVSGT